MDRGDRDCVFDRCLFVDIDVAAWASSKTLLDGATCDFVEAFLALLVCFCGGSRRPAPLAQDPSTVAKSAGVWQAAGDGGAISAGGAAAVAAGKTVLESGGNAADAAVATILAMTVTDSSMFCFGGEVPLLVYDARRGAVDVVCGQGCAPRLATRNIFHRPLEFPARGSKRPQCPLRWMPASSCSIATAP